MTSTPPEPDQPFGVNQPSYPGDAGQYGSFPSQPQSNAPVEKPGSITTAVKLMLFGAGLSVLTLIYSLTTLGDLKDEIREQAIKDDPNVSQSTIDAAYAIGISFAVIFGLFGALLWVWMAWKNGQGRSWARVVATVFGGLNVLGALFTFSSGTADSLSVGSTLVSLALAVIILVLLWKPESTRFYQASAAARMI